MTNEVLTKPDVASGSSEVRTIVLRLRRFGGMLLETEAEADRAIAAALSLSFDSIVQINSEDPAGLELALFKSFLDAVKTENPEDLDAGLVDDDTLELFQSLNRDERTFFLLRHVEEFSMEITADIMGLSRNDLESLEQCVNRKFSTVTTS